MAPALIVVATLGPIAEMQVPVAGFVSHRKMLIGNAAAPVSAEAVIAAVAPTFTVATEKAPVPFVPGIFTMPSLVVVAAKATMSGTGVADAESSNVFSPGLIAARLALVQTNPNSISVGAIGALGVKAKTKLCGAPSAIFTGVFGLPMTALVAGLVVW